MYRCQVAQLSNPSHITIICNTFTSTTRSVDVAEVGVLSVGKIKEGQVPGVCRLSASDPLRLQALLALVLPDKAVTEENKDTELDAVGNEDGSDTKLVLGSLLGLVEEGG